MIPGLKKVLKEKLFQWGRLFKTVTRRERHGVHLQVQQGQMGFIAKKPGDQASTWKITQRNQGVGIPVKLTRQDSWAKDLHIKIWRWGTWSATKGERFSIKWLSRSEKVGKRTNTIWYHSLCWHYSLAQLTSPWNRDRLLDAEQLVAARGREGEEAWRERGEQMRAAAHRMDKQGPAAAQGTTLNTLRQTTTERSAHACACVQLNPSVVPQKLTSHCRSTALHLSKVT